VLQFSLQDSDLFYLTVTFSNIMISDCCSLLRLAELSSHPSGSLTLELLQTHLLENVQALAVIKQYADFTDSPSESQEFK
jgi:hypothetical protein